MNIFYLISIIIASAAALVILLNPKNKWGYIAFLASYLPLFYKQVFLDDQILIAAVNLALVTIMALLVKIFRKGLPE